MPILATVSIGLGPNKSLAKMASDRDKPDGFLSLVPLKRKLVSASVLFFLALVKRRSKITQRRLSWFADRCRANELHLAAVLGSQTRQIMALKGIDQRPVTPERAKSISMSNIFL